MRIIAIANQKGGCGKTTTAINLSACLAFLRKSVLLIDLDPQGHATCGLGIKAEFLDKTAYDLFQDALPSITDLIVCVNDYLSLIPAHVVLSRAEQEWAGCAGAYERLASRVNEIKEAYDFTIIDLPPNLGLFTYNALCASDEVIIPIEPSFFALHGLAKIFETIDSFGTSRSRKLRLHALLTRCEKRTKLGREIKEEVHKYFKEQVFVNTIDENIRLREAAASGKSIVDFDRESSGFRNYMGLAIEVIERGLLWQEIDSLPREAKDITLIQNSTVHGVSPEGHADFLIHDGNGTLSFEHDKATSIRPDDKKHSSGHCPPPPATVLKLKNKLLDPEICEAASFYPRKVFGGILFSHVDSKAISVLIAGDFNHWVAEPLTLVDKESGCWQKIIPLEPGVHRYKYLADDEWRVDPSNQAMESNTYGGFDSVIVVDESPSNDGLSSRAVSPQVN